jgi:hypothetical protein
MLLVGAERRERGDNRPPRGAEGLRGTAPHLQWPKGDCRHPTIAPPSKEAWRERLAEPLEGLYSLVGCVEGEVVGNLGLHTSPRWRMRHVGSIGMVVRDDWQGKGVAHGAYGGGAGPGEQLAEPDAQLDARLRGER